MARALTFKIQQNVIWSYTNAADLSTPTDAKSLSWLDTNLTSGYAAINKADRLWHDTRTLTATTAEEIDVYDLAVDGGAAGTDTLGQTVAAATVKAIIIRNNSVIAADNLTIGGEASTAAWNSPFGGSDSASVTLGPGGKITMEAPSIAGYAVADTTNHLLKIDNATANSIIYDIVIVFATA
jgi:hypothetical protein